MSNTSFESLPAEHPTVVQNSVLGYQNARFKEVLGGPIFLCGHHEGVDCSSGGRTVNDFVTNNEEVAKSHIKTFDGSWSNRGFYTRISAKWQLD